MSFELKLQKEPFVSSPSSNGGFARAITTHDVCAVPCSTLAALLRVLSSRGSLRTPVWWDADEHGQRVFQQAVPLRSQWSTVFPHTNTFCGEFRAPCSANICFPKWFCYWGALAPSHQSRVRFGPPPRHQNTLVHLTVWNLHKWYVAMIFGHTVETNTDQHPPSQLRHKEENQTGVQWPCNCYNC